MSQDQLRAAAQAALNAWNNDKGLYSAMVELRNAIEADAEQCEWESDEYFFWGECHRSVMEISKHPQQYMAYCYGCGKRIKFKESEE